MQGILRYYVMTKFGIGGHVLIASVRWLANWLSDKNDPGYLSCFQKSSFGGLDEWIPDMQLEHLIRNGLNQTLISNILDQGSSMEFPLSGLPSWFDSALTSQFTSPASHPHPRDRAHLPFCKNYYKFRPKAACESSFSHLKSLILLRPPVRGERWAHLSQRWTTLPIFKTTCSM